MAAKDYGAILNDQFGRTFARVDGGTSYHYWGKIEFNNLTPSFQEAWLFNVPSSVPVSVFICCEFNGNENYMSRVGAAELRQRDGKWLVRVRASNIGEVQRSFVKCTFYLFLPGSYIAAKSYGVQCFNENGVKVFDSARPLLQICGKGAGGLMTTGSASFFNRTPAKCASAYSATTKPFFTVVQGVAYWAIISYYGTTTGGALAGFTGMINYLDQGGTEPWSRGSFNNVPLIDAGYYDQFANLGYM